MRPRLKHSSAISRPSPQQPIASTNSSIVLRRLLCEPRTAPVTAAVLHLNLEQHVLEVEVVTGGWCARCLVPFWFRQRIEILRPLTDIGARKSRIESGSIGAVCGAKTPAGCGITISDAAAYKKAGSRLFVGKSFPYSPLEVVPTIGKLLQANGAIRTSVGRGQRGRLKRHRHCYCHNGDGGRWSPSSGWTALASLAPFVASASSPGTRKSECDVGKAALYAAIIRDC